MPDGPLIGWEQLHPTEKPSLVQTATHVSTPDNKADIPSRLPVRFNESDGMLDMSRCYPRAKQVRTRPKVVSLVTGSALIQPTVNCWVTQEEYARLLARMRVEWASWSPFDIVQVASAR